MYQYCSILLTAMNNVGSKTLFNPVFISIASTWAFLRVCNHIIYSFYSDLCITVLFTCSFLMWISGWLCEPHTKGWPCWLKWEEGRGPTLQGEIQKPRRAGKLNQTSPTDRASRLAFRVELVETPFNISTYKFLILLLHFKRLHSSKVQFPAHKKANSEVQILVLKQDSPLD